MPLSGPMIGPVELAPKAGGLIAGRHEQCDIKLAADTVSRQHARLLHESSGWRLVDLKSRWGTYVNGVRVPADQEIPLGEGDLVRISPWTFRFTSNADSSAGRELDSHDDLSMGGTIVQTISNERMGNLSEDLLSLLLESAAGIHAARDEKALGELLVEKACQGTGMPNAALLRPVNDAGRYEVIASRASDGQELSSYSRSLLSAAAGGNVAELSGTAPDNVSESIISMGVRTALCVPIMLGQIVAACLYLDARSTTTTRRPHALRPNASAFCLALARMAGLAMSNLKRIDMERRSAQIESDLAAAATAQQWILPQHDGKFGPFSYVGASRPGRHVGGDFYDLIPLDEQRLGIAIGDVSGKGVAASVLMTAAQGFLHAALEETGDPQEAIIRLNRFIYARSQMDKFVTLWVGVLDLGTKTIRFVDAGHGYAMLGDSVPALRRLSIGGQLPVGVDENTEYMADTSPLSDSGCALLLSDGIIEQPAAGDSGRGDPFDMTGVERVMSKIAPQADPIAALFDAVVKHAGRTTLADDATAVLVKWE